MSGDVRILRREEVGAVLSRRAAAESAIRAFRAVSAGRALSPMPFEMLFPDHRGEVHGKGGYQAGSDRYAVKLASWFAGDATSGPHSRGATLVFDATTGALTHLVADDGLLTEWRTAAAAAVATDALARAEAREVLIVGAGVLAGHLPAALLERRPGWRVSIWARDRDAAGRVAIAAADEAGAEIAVCTDLEQAVRRSEVVVTATSARSGLLAEGWVRPGTQITTVGSDTPVKRELDPRLLARCDRLVVDSLVLARHVGETHWAVEAGLVSWAAVVELGSVLAGTAPGRTDSDQTTHCDLSGLGIQDALIAEEVVDAADSCGLGAVFPSASPERSHR